MKQLALVLVLFAGCALDDSQDGELGSVEQAVTGFLTSPQNYYYYQAGVYWFEDSYSHKWCTNATAQIAVWDYNTSCNWDQWYDATYHQYCDARGDFWQDKYYHYHCP
jgi:hypothetical protein